MGNIIGESFPEKIRNQINVRQKIYGSGWSQNRTPHELVYLTNNTAWCKLVSSTEISNLDNINNPTIKGFGNDVLGTGLAKNFVLFNGTSKIEENGSMTPRGGIDTQNTLGGNQRAYGIGGSADFGIRPMMGIESIKVQHKNRGSIRTATVNVKAWNKTQFEIIDVLYLRVGFSVLLEWGNAMYFDNDGSLQQAGLTNSLANDFFKNSDYDVMLKKIQNQRLATFGNYDAMFGKVTNFHWSFQPDGSYDITIDLVSIGDIVESFKINAAPSTINTPQQDQNSEAANSTIWKRLATEKNKHAIAEFLDRELNSLPPGVYVKVNSSRWYETTGKSKTNPKIFKENISNLIVDIILIPGSPGGQASGLSSIEVQGPIRPQSQEGVAFPGSQAFIRLGYFLEWIQDSLLYRSQGKNSNNRIPILKIDTNPETNIMGILKETPTYDNYGYPVGHIINQMSYDPFVCMVRKDLPGGGDESLAKIRTFSKSTAARGFDVTYLSDRQIFNLDFTSNGPQKSISEPFDLNIEGKSYGKIMNIYLNFEFILDKMNELMDETTGRISFVDFIKALLEGINGAMGGVNQLDLIIDETSNAGKIIDKNPYPSPDSVLKYFDLQRESVEFQMYGYGKNPLDEKVSGFIKDFKLTTELTPEFSTLITVGATANNTVVGEDSTALSKLNKGLVDRYKENIEETVVPYNPVVFEAPSSPPPTASAAGFIESNRAIPIDENADVQNEIPYYLKERNFSEYQRYLLAAFNIDSSYQPSDQPEPNSFYQYLILLAEYGWRREYASTFKSQFQTIYRYWNQYKYVPGTAPTFKTGFIPFNLSLTLDGLSGMKIYQKFNVNTDFLPSNYPNSIEFLIKNITHEINGNKWTTNLESFCVSKPNSETVKNAAIPNAAGAGLGTSSTVPVDPQPTPDWSKYNVGNTLLLKRAVKDQSTYIYNTYKETTGQCAGYTYRIAYNLKEYIDTNSTKAIPLPDSKPTTFDADDNRHRRDILLLDIYEEFYLGAYTATELESGFFNKFSWNYGDIVNYYSPGNTGDDTNMHTQIYTGDIWKIGINNKKAKVASNSGWSTSGATNYGAQFVYSESNKVFKVYAYKVKPEYLK